MPLNPQSTLPFAGSYKPARVALTQTSPVRSFVFQTNGVAHDDLSLRSTRHFSSPDFLSSAARNDFSSLSHCTNNKSLASAGEPPVPQPAIILNAPRSFVQSLLPSRS